MKFIMCLVLFLIIFSRIYAQWTVKSLPDVRQQLIQIKTTDYKHIIVASTYGIFTSSDRGETWAAPDPSSSFPSYSTGLLAVAGTSYIAGISRSHIEYGAHFTGMKSLDYGHSWLPVQNLWAALSSISFGSDSVGYMGGTFVAHTGKYCFVKTTDGGYTWNNVTNDMNPYTKIRSVFFLNDSLGWIASYGFLKTTDGGVHWSQPKRDDLLINDLYFLNKDIGWMFTDNHLLKTTDGGNDWVVSDVDTGSDILKRVVFLNQDYGYLLTNNNVFMSSDGGSTWLKMEMPISVSDMNDMTLAKDSSIWICGNNGLILNYKTKFIIDSIGNDTTENDTTKLPLLPDQYALAQNYPNPFNPETFIEYNISKSAYINITVYDILGNEVFNLIEGYHNPGNYRISWNGKNRSGNDAAGGIYLYKMNFGSQSLTRKMILLR